MMKLERNSKMSNLEKQKNQLTLTGKKPKLKGGFRCSKCHDVLYPIDEVTFKPSSLAEQLKRKGYTHVCVRCKIAYARKESTETEKEYKCLECNGELSRLIANGQLVGYYCFNCKLLYNKEAFSSENEKLKRGVN